MTSLCGVQRQNKTQERKTDESLSFLGLRQLGDVFIMWHKCLVRISEISAAARISEGKRKAHEDSPQRMCQVASASL